MFALRDLYNVNMISEADFKELKLDLLCLGKVTKVKHTSDRRLKTT